MSSMIFRLLTISLALVSASLGEEFYLTTYFAESVTQGYRTTENNLSIDGNALRLDGKTYARGLGTHANGEIVYRLGGAAQRFLALVGIDDETNKLGTVVFKVVADGKELFDSGVMQGGQPPKSIDLDIRGVDELRLVSDGTADRIGFDHSDWAEARIVTIDKGLIERIRETEKVNHINLRDIETVAALCASETPMRITTPAGATVLSYYPAAGVYDIQSGDGRIANARLLVNGEEVLPGAPVGVGERSLTITSKFKAFEIETAFGVHDNDWLTLQVTIHNTAAEPRKLYSLAYLHTPLEGVLKDKRSTDLHFFTDSYSVWDQMPGHDKVGDSIANGKYIGVIFSPGHPQAWTLGWQPPQDWPGSIMVDGHQGRCRAYIDLYGKPFVLKPDETVVFDRMMIAGNFNLIDGLLAYGRSYRPHFSLDQVKKINGYNSWEYFKGDIHADNMGQILDAVTNWAPARETMTYFVLDNGWKKAYGDWSFIESKWPGGGQAWAERVRNAGLIPGLWLAPFWVAPDLARQWELRDYTQNEQGGLAQLRVRIDPSDPGLKKQLVRQIGDLRDMGFRYFKTDFLFDGYKGDRDYKYSRFAPERVLREFMTALREAMGPDSYWLACGTLMAPCAGLVDASRVGMDIKAGWSWLRDTIVRRNAARFWMHGNLWLCDQDVLIVRGPKQWVKGYEEPLAVDVPAAGFTPEEAQTWCAWLVITGGPVTWSDHPLGINDTGRDLVARTLRHGGGHSGVPLDLESTNLPAKWVRQESGRLYLALFNWDEKEQTLTIVPSEVSALKDARQAVDIFTGQTVELNEGVLSATLKPHQSLCVMIKK